MITDIPTITDASHSHSVYGLGNMGTPLAAYAGTTTGIVNHGPYWGEGGRATSAAFHVGGALQNAQAAAAAFPGDDQVLKKAKAILKEKPVTRRLVQVFIADPDDNVPLEKSLLYTGDQKLTDATDQELFFEIDMKTILAAHNAMRITLINKKVKERTENLEPVKIRDLKMVVTTVATF